MRKFLWQWVLPVVAAVATGYAIGWSTDRFAAGGSRYSQTTLFLAASLIVTILLMMAYALWRSSRQ